MPIYPLAPSLAFRQYARCLRELHTLIARGEDESPAGDAIRDESDDYWSAMTPAERERARGLSADLYSLPSSNDEPEPFNPQARRQIEEAWMTKQRGEWDRALRLFRRWAKFVEPAALSRLRGDIWLKAGDPETAVVFFANASRLRPDNGPYAVFHLLTLMRVHPQEAERIAKELLANPSLLPPAAVVAAGIVLQHTATQATAPGMILAVQDAAKRLEQQDDLLGDQIAHRASFAVLGSLQVAVGRPFEARDTFDHGIAIYPDDAVLFVCRGLAAGLTGPVGVSDLERAASLDPSQLWADYLLARYYLATEDAERCRQHSERAVNKNGPDAVRCEAAQWLGIARLALGYPLAAVREAFQLAIKICPEDDRAAENLRRFESFIDTQERPEWVTRSDVEVRATGWQVAQMPLAA